ncbi:MAG: hypothetical protein V4663_06020 [Bacteroidota bacterium]
MAFISKEDFQTHIYEENINKISRNDDAKFLEAVNTAMQKARRSLTRYNVDAIFETEGDDKEKYGELINYIKDIAKFHFIKVANIEIDYDLAEKAFNTAIKELREIKDGESVDGWPLKENNTESLFRSGSSSKFNHHF